MERLSVQRVVALACLLIFVSLLAPAMLHREAGGGLSKAILPTVHAQTGCTLATVNGSYRFIRTGFVTVNATTAHFSGFLPLAAVGLTAFDGAGTMGGATVSIVVGGSVGASNAVSTSPTGSYTINSDCTGTITLSPSTSPNFNIVVAPDGSEILGIQVVGGETATIDFKKQ